MYDLSLGNPIVEPPSQFGSDLLRLANDKTPGMHRYMPNAGYPETRSAVAASLTAETDLSFTQEDIVMTCGAGGALNIVI